MIVIVGSRFDTVATQLCERWPDVGLLACEDLSRPGWRVRGTPNTDVVVVGAREVPSKVIQGVFVRRTRVYPAELGYVAVEDRAYVAAEMTAFLRYWLGTLTCQLINAPSDRCLSGPGWTPLEWVYHASANGLSVVPWTGGCPDIKRDRMHEVVVLDGVVVSKASTDEAVMGDSLSLARAAGARLLGVTFMLSDTERRFLRATTMPDLNDSVVDALHRVLR